MYYFVYFLLYLLSLLPFSILYAISSLAAFLLQNVIRYRKDTVLNNLLIAFPEKSDEERKRIANQFYINFTDSFIETIKTLSISKKSMSERCIGDFSIINKAAKEGKNIQLLGAHMFNLEYAILALSKNLNLHFIVVFANIQNAIFNRLFVKIRAKYGGAVIMKNDFKNKKDEIMKVQHAQYLLADQSPSNIKKAYWLNFFGKLAPFIPGPHMAAGKNNTTVIFMNFRKIKRGYYSVDVEKVIETPSNYTPEQLTVLYRNFVEHSIRKQPENYLWSHRRWKREYSDEYAQNRIES